MRLALTAHLDLRGAPPWFPLFHSFLLLPQPSPATCCEPLHWSCRHNPVFMATWPPRLLKQPRLRSSPDTHLQALARSLPPAFRI